MKIRNGFVSNSSSSSFVIRGIKMDIKELAKILNIEFNNDDKLYEISDDIWSEARKYDLDVREDRYYFSDDVADKVIIGERFTSLEDGEIIELSEPNDVEVKEKLEKMGIKTDKLSTFVQYISNDNY